VAWTLADSQAVTFSDGNAGHSYTFPAGAPSAGALDVLCVNSDTTVSTPSSVGGASWTLGPSFVSNQGAYIWYRVATGGEPSTVTITTSGNFATFLGYSRWTAGTITADVNVQGHEENGNFTATPTATTAALAATGELSVAFGALHDIQASTAPTSPVWSTNYTALETANSGTTTHDVTGYVGYFTNAGTAAESPSVSWTNTIQDAYMLVQAFQTVVSGTSAPAGLAASTGVPPAGTESTIRLGMTIRGS
jgi:hypothetical protein